MPKYFALAMLSVFIASSDVLARGPMSAAGRAGYVHHNTTDDTLRMLSLGVFALAIIFGVLGFIGRVIAFLFGLGGSDSREVARQKELVNPWATEDERKDG